MVNLLTSSTSHFVNSHFVNIDQMGIDEMGIDKVGIDEVGINRVCVYVYVCVRERESLSEIVCQLRKPSSI